MTDREQGRCRRRKVNEAWNAFIVMLWVTGFVVGFTLAKRWVK